MSSKIQFPKAAATAKLKTILITTKWLLCAFCTGVIQWLAFGAAITLVNAVISFVFGYIVTALLMVPVAAAVAAVLPFIAWIKLEHGSQKDPPKP